MVEHLKSIEQIIEEKLHLIFDDTSIVFDKSRFAGGMTNCNYIMNIHGTEYIIRKPGNMTSKMIDRKIEGINNKIASEFGINSDCIYFDEITGIKISVYIKNSQNIALADPSSPDNITAVCNLMKKTHASSKHFPNKFDWQHELAKYEQIVHQIHGDLFSDYMDLKSLLLKFIRENVKSTTSVPCHNDTVPENFVMDDTGRAYLIDWEYSGMNDPAFDVAAYILESRLSKDAIDFLLLNYYGSEVPDAEIVKIKSYMMAQDLLWTAWALIRHYGGDDYLDYCSLRYDRFRKNIKALMISSDYSLYEMVMV